jgi:UDP-N-acetylglucosamine 2-epimerase
MRIAYVVGARPNFVKMAPVIAERSQIGRRRRMPDGHHALIHTGQHYDRLMSDVFLEELGDRWTVPSQAKGTFPQGRLSRLFRSWESLTPHRPV